MACGILAGMDKRILVVDDDAAIVSALTSLFARAGYVVDAARTGPAALDQLTRRPDLVVLDLMLPGVDGYDICRHIRRQEPYIPIVMLSARDETDDRVLGLELGADAYLTKPFEPGELLAQVRAVFRTVSAREGGARGPLAVNGVRLWEAQHHVEVDGQRVELSPKEFELLRHFMRHPGQVFGRETLLREIWGYVVEVDSRTVDTHIQRLRAKIEPEPATPTRIETVRGFGYRLAADTSQK